MARDSIKIVSMMKACFRGIGLKRFPRLRKLARQSLIGGGGMKVFLRGFSVVCVLAVFAAMANDAGAQGWGWGGGPPWGGGDGPSPYDQPPPRPVYGQPAYGGSREPSPSFGSMNPRCHELEAQLTNGSSNAGQDQLPRIEDDMRQADAQFHRAQSDAERSDCYEDMFLFGRSLRRSPRCVDLDRQVQAAKAQLAQLKAQRDAAMRGSSPRGRRDDIVAELARNHCGEQYAHEYEGQRRSRSSSIFSFFTNEENSPDEPPSSSPFAPSPPPGYGGGSSSYRTWCVRECDGFYFPVSNYTSEGQFQADEEKCHSLCASPAELFYHRADQDVDQMVSLNGRPYTSMPFAFRNRKVYIRGCSCKASEYSPEQIAESEKALKLSKRADATGKSDAAFARRISQAVQNAPGQPVSASPAPRDAATPLETVPQPNPQR